MSDQPAPKELELTDLEALAHKHVVATYLRAQRKRQRAEREAAKATSEWLAAVAAARGMEIPPACYVRIKPGGKRALVLAAPPQQVIPDNAIEAAAAAVDQKGAVA